MQVYLGNNYLCKLYEGKEFVEDKYDCSCKEFFTVVETLASLDDISDCTSINFLRYTPPKNGNNNHSVHVNANVCLLFKQEKVDEITITGIQ